ncbi:hypothetical protein Ddye_001110 [Dipteronia dyeriana]|uniref:DDE Tnp4 domain-containing protein n=1 Tax=Dipteronia dyeriana TaxID=168575 RepID=A0AAD9XMU6_9ROSI|nr:hypothetical protein Ddye_001110 [Dipteronia dyeriana]
MDRNAFAILCELLKTRGGLLNDCNVTIEEQVATFVHILAHHFKNRSIQGCIGALDGTYKEMTVPESDKPRYRTRKRHIATNVLSVCTCDLKFVYVLSSWEGSTTDSRVLQDAITRHNGLKVSFGNYYSADAKYTNGQCFLAPYRGSRMYMDVDPEEYTPRNHEEYFNMKHSQARNIIDRCFGLLKKRWAVIRSPSFYPIRFQGRMIIVCALLHNFIRMYMDVDPKEYTPITLDELPIDEDISNELESIDVVEASDEWS